RFAGASLLPGIVIVSGGVDASGRALAAAEQYDVRSGAWARVADMIAARADHTAIVLGNGQVLIAGGYGASGQVQASAELYDPQTGTWAATGPMRQARANHTASS